MMHYLFLLTLLASITRALGIITGKICKSLLLRLLLNKVLGKLTFKGMIQRRVRSERSC